jgi:hypothetical protein
MWRWPSTLVAAIFQPAIGCRKSEMSSDWIA